VVVAFEFTLFFVSSQKYLIHSLIENMHNKKYLLIKHTYCVPNFLNFTHVVFIVNSSQKLLFLFEASVTLIIIKLCFILKYFP
jgi:hypothetical protein